MITHRKDFDGVQPWPTKREHVAIGRISGQIGLNTDEGWADPVIPFDEPVLLLQATDPLASMVTDFYADLIIARSGEKELVDAVTLHAARMRTYREAHAPEAAASNAVPDVDKGWLRT